MASTAYEFRADPALRPMPSAAAAYDPARRQNPYAASRALEYAIGHGSADAALSIIEGGNDYPDALMRAVCDELRQIRRCEWAAMAQAEAGRAAA